MGIQLSTMKIINKNFRTECCYTPGHIHYLARLGILSGCRGRGDNTLAIRQVRGGGIRGAGGIRPAFPSQINYCFVPDLFTIEIRLRSNKIQRIQLHHSV